MSCGVKNVHPWCLRNTKTLIPVLKNLFVNSSTLRGKWLLPVQLYSVLTVLSLVNIKKYIKKRVVDLLVRKVFFFKSVMRFFLQFYIQSVAAAIVLEWINTSSVILLVILFLKYPFITSSFFLKNVCIRIYRSDPVKNKINFSNNLRKTHCYLCTKSRHKQLHKKLVIMLKTITLWVRSLKLTIFPQKSVF